MHNDKFSINQFKRESQSKSMRKVAALTRVSTKHEQQINALENQNDWIVDEIVKHPDWIFDVESDLYTDSGVSGTSTKNRVEFNTMIQRAKAGEYDLIVTREVSRFMRNLKLTLTLVDELKECGVEVWFVNDAIWTFKKDDYFKLTRMGSLAEQESKKTSDRVIAGQATSRKKGVLYGSGNILGYDLIKGEKSEDNTYKINEEQAETVRRIYELALGGTGIKRIKNILTEEGRKSPGGQGRWYESKTYCGYMEYMKSYTEDPITHKRKNQKDVSKRPEVKGDFEPIISVEMWEAVQRSIDSRVNHDFNNRYNGKLASQDVYCRKMRCECGRRMRKDKGRKDGMATYKCYSIVENGSVKAREKQGVSTEGCCSLPGIIDWKLQLYTQRVFGFLTVQTDLIKEKVLKAVEESYADEKKGVLSQRKVTALKSSIEKLEARLERLTDMRADGELSKEEYLKRKEETAKEVLEKRTLLQEAEQIKDGFEAKEECLAAVGVFLDEALHFDCNEVSDDLIDMYVNSIKVYNNNTFEYNICLNPNSKSDRPERDNEMYKAYEGKSAHIIDNSNAQVLAEFTIGYDEAKKFANALKRRVSRVHWQEATIRIVADI